MMVLSELQRLRHGTSVVTRPVLALLLMVVVTGAGCRETERSAAVLETAHNVRILELSPTTISEYFEVSGPVAPVRGTDLSAEESGPVVTLSTAKGATVVAGQILIELDRTILKAQRDAAQAALETQSFNVDKVRRLHEAGKLSQIELLTAESAFAQAEAVAAVSAKRYRRAAVRAPFAGVLADRFVELGELVTPGMPVARVIDPYTLKLEAYLTDEQVRWVPVGAAATVALAGLGEPVLGNVSWVGFEADRLTGKFKVEIELPNPELRLRSGVIGRARLGKSISRDVVSIPRDAVLPGQTGATAFVVRNQRAARRELTLGASQGLMVEVVSGLAFGDSLIVRGQRDVREGSLVEITEQTRRSDGATASDPAVVTGQGVTSRVAERGAVAPASNLKAEAQR